MGVIIEGLMRILLAIFLLASSSAWGQFGSIIESSFKSSQSGCPLACKNLEQKARLQLATVIGQENRETFSEYAANRNMDLNQVHEKYSATGSFHCGGKTSSANVAFKKNRIALCAHQFFEKGTCNRKKGLSDCYFETIVPPGETPQQLKINVSTLRLGTECPIHTNGEDWAVVDLVGEVQNVKPYNVAKVNDLASPKDEFEGLIDLQTTTVVARNNNFRDYPYETPSLCDGKIGGIQSSINKHKVKSFFIASNCSSGDGNSGGGFFIQSGNVPTLVGVLSGSNGTDYLPFGPTNFTAGALVEGKFFNALTR